MTNTLTSATSTRDEVPPRLKLSALWASTMFLYIYVDIFHLYKPGIIDEIRAGRVWEFDISQTWAFSALVLMAIPSLMVSLTLTLRSSAARWANIVMASLFTVVSIFNLVGETWGFYWLGAILETALLVAVVRYAWRWR